MASKPGILTWSNISNTKGNQTMTLGQSIKHVTWEIFFFKNPAENEDGRLVPEFFCFKKSVI